MSFGTIGLLGIGEMGSAIARTLGAHATVITTLEGRSAKTRANAEAAGVTDVGSMDEMVRQADLVLSVLASDAAPVVASEVADAARRVGVRVLFGEFNAIAPVTVQAIESEYADAMDVVDGGIVGGPRNLATASFYLSGPRADEVASLREYGINTVPLGPVVGQASGAKLCHAGMTKGVSTLALDILLAAEALGVAETVLAQYSRSMAGVLDFVDRFVPGNPKRAFRRAEENAGGREDAGRAGLQRKHPSRCLRAHALARVVGAGHRWGALGVGRGRSHRRRHSLDARGVTRRQAIAFGTPLELRYPPSTSGMLWCLGFRAANSAKNTSAWITTYNQRMTT